jgi:TetR/AcrR family transcriptional regulator, transcriptional repressor for nem operon
MPRVSKQQADANRTTIAETSSQLFRERGFNGVSVDDLMAAAGLTHGGFYGHFASKGALAAEACGLAFDQSCARWNTCVADRGGGSAARAALVERYLSLAARAKPGTACPMAGLAGDVAREAADAPVREVYVSGFEKLLDILASCQNTRDAATDRREALADLSTLVGSMVLARATAGHGVSDELLAAGRARLVSQAQPERKSARRKGRHVR